MTPQILMALCLMLIISAYLCYEYRRIGKMPVAQFNQEKPLRFALVLCFVFMPVFYWFCRSMWVVYG